MIVRSRCGLRIVAGELIGLTMWLLKQRKLRQLDASYTGDWDVLMESLPLTTNSPLLWSSSERLQFLQGTTLVTEVDARLVRELRKAKYPYGQCQLGTCY